MGRRTALALAAMLITAGAWAEDFEPPPSAPIATSFGHVCFYAGKLYSIGAEAQLNGSVMVCAKGEDGAPQWERLFAPSASILANSARSPEQ